MKLTERQKQLLEKEVVMVATLNKDGTPNVIPVACVKVVSQGEVVITDNFMKLTNENIRRNPNVCLAVWTKDWKQGYKFVGRAEYRAKGKWLKFVKAIKDNQSLPAKGAIVVKIKQVYKLG